MKTFAFFLVLSAIALIAASPAYAEGLTPQDYMEIEQLYAQYNWAIDTGDAGAYANTFIADGVFNSMTGHEQLAGFIKRWVETMNGATRKHWNTNLKISGDGDTASGQVYLMLLDTSTQPPAIVATATYTDSLVKTQDGWRFSKRSTQSDRAPRAAN
ncbi:MAG: nuclear transport factor 2 family protein [Cellvibrionaceae bacterium]